MAVVCQHWLTNGATTCDAPPTTFPFHGPSLIVCLLRRLSLVESGKLASNNSNETREKTKATRILIPRPVIQSSALNFKANEIARLSLRPTFFFSLSSLSLFLFPLSVRRIDESSEQFVLLAGEKKSRRADSSIYPT